MSSSMLPSRFVWHDCLTPDIDLAIDFFTPLTDWKVWDQTSPNMGRYPIIRGPNGAVAGMLEMPKFLQSSGVPPYWTGYVRIDVKLAEEKIPALGGHMFTLPTTSATGMSFIFTDPGGAVLAAYEPAGSFVVPSVVNAGEIVWQRLYTRDLERSLGFYAALFDWRVAESASDMKIVLDGAAEVVGDMGPQSSWIDADTWVYFIGVGDLVKTAAGVEARGGEVVAHTMIQNRAAVVVKDSQGGVVGFSEW